MSTEITESKILKANPIINKSVQARLKTQTGIEFPLTESWYNSLIDVVCATLDFCSILVV
jgi:hypothetical protein